MNEFRKKQKKLKKIMNILLMFTTVYLFVYIGIEPIIAKACADIVTIILGYLCDGLIIAALIVLFIYYSKYSKSDKFLQGVEDELDDTGYYITAREEKDIESYKDAVITDLRNNGYKVDEKVEIDELEFTAVAQKKNEVVYILDEDVVDKNDVIAYLQSAIYDIVNINIKRRANCVLLYICNQAEDGAVSLSKAITPLGKKEQVKFANAIVELSTGRCYFLGNKPTKCQQMIANYAMNCNIPIDEKYIGTEKLPFQSELAEHMKDFNLKDFKDGTFYAH